jgi:hypothetical protein
MALGKSLACISLAIWFGGVSAVPPTQTVSNLRFEDTNLEGGWLSGVIRWDPPANTDGISTYGVLIFNNINDIMPNLPDLPGDFSGAWYLCDAPDIMHHAAVGTNEFTIKTAEALEFPRRGSTEVQPMNRRRYSWGHYHPSDRYLVVVCINEQKEAGPRVIIPIYDASPHLPIPHLDNITFTDTNDILGVLDGKISWEPDVEGDFTLTQSYLVFLASDESGTDEAKIGETAVPEFELMLSGVSRESRDFIRIRGVNPNGVSPWSRSVRIFDSGPSPPSEGVTDLAFIDSDYREGYVAGNVTWTPPDDEAPISSYRLFLSNQQGVGGEKVPSDGYTIPVGTNYFTLPAHALRSSQDYVQVYTANDKGMQDVPAELAILDTIGA